MSQSRVQQLDLSQLKTLSIKEDGDCTYGVVAETMVDQFIAEGNNEEGHWHQFLKSEKANEFWKIVQARVNLDMENVKKDAPGVFRFYFTNKKTEGEILRQEDLVSILRQWNMVLLQKKCEEDNNFKNQFIDYEIGVIKEVLEEFYKTDITISTDIEMVTAEKVNVVENKCKEKGVSNLFKEAIIEYVENQDITKEKIEEGMKQVSGDFSLKENFLESEVYRILCKDNLSTDENVKVGQIERMKESLYANLIEDKKKSGTFTGIDELWPIAEVTEINLRKKVDEKNGKVEIEKPVYPYQKEEVNEYRGNPTIIFEFINYNHFNALIDLREQTQPQQQTQQQQTQPQSPVPEIKKTHNFPLIAGKIMDLLGTYYNKGGKEGDFFKQYNYPERNEIRKEVNVILQDLTDKDIPEFNNMIRTHYGIYPVAVTKENFVNEICYHYFDNKNKSRSQSPQGELNIEGQLQQTKKEPQKILVKINQPIEQQKIQTTPIPTEDRDKQIADIKKIITDKIMPIIKDIESDPHINAKAIQNAIRDIKRQFNSILNLINEALDKGLNDINYINIKAYIEVYIKKYYIVEVEDLEKINPSLNEKIKNLRKESNEVVKIISSGQQPQQTSTTQQLQQTTTTNTSTTQPQPQPQVQDTVNGTDQIEDIKEIIQNIINELIKTGKTNENEPLFQVKNAFAIQLDYINRLNLPNVTYTYKDVKPSVNNTINFLTRKYESNKLIKSNELDSLIINLKNKIELVQLPQTQPQQLHTTQIQQVQKTTTTNTSTLQSQSQITDTSDITNKNQRVKIEEIIVKIVEELKEIKELETVKALFELDLKNLDSLTQEDLKKQIRDDINLFNKTVKDENVVVSGNLKSLIEDLTALTQPIQTQTQQNNKKTNENLNQKQTNLEQSQSQNKQSQKQTNTIQSKPQVQEKVDRTDQMDEIKIIIKKIIEELIKTGEANENGPLFQPRRNFEIQHDHIDHGDYKSLGVNIKEYISEGISFLNKSLKSKKLTASEELSDLIEDLENKIQLIQQPGQTQTQKPQNRQSREINKTRTDTPPPPKIQQELTRDKWIKNIVEKITSLMKVMEGLPNKGDYYSNCYAGFENVLHHINNGRYVLPQGGGPDDREMIDGITDAIRFLKEHTVNITQQLYASISDLNKAILPPQTQQTNLNTPRTGTPRTGTPRTGTPRTNTPRTNTPPPHGQPPQSTSQSPNLSQYGEYIGHLESLTDEIAKKAKQYEYDFGLISDISDMNPRQPGKIYLKSIDEGLEDEGLENERLKDGLHYEVIDPDNNLKIGRIPWESLPPREDFPRDIREIILWKGILLPKLLPLTSEAGDTRERHLTKSQQKQINGKMNRITTALMAVLATPVSRETLDLLKTQVMNELDKLERDYAGYNDIVPLIQDYKHYANDTIFAPELLNQFQETIVFKSPYVKITDHTLLPKETYETAKNRIFNDLGITTSTMDSELSTVSEQLLKRSLEGGDLRVHQYTDNLVLVEEVSRDGHCTIHVERVPELDSHDSHIKNMQTDWRTFQRKQEYKKQQDITRQDERLERAGLSNFSRLVGAFHQEDLEKVLDDLSSKRLSFNPENVKKELEEYRNRLEKNIRNLEEQLKGSIENRYDLGLITDSRSYNPGKIYIDSNEGYSLALMSMTEKPTLQNLENTQTPPTLIKHRDDYYLYGIATDGATPILNKFKSTELFRDLDFHDAIPVSSTQNPEIYNVIKQGHTSRDEGLRYEVIGLDNTHKIGTIPWNRLPEGFPRNPLEIMASKEEHLPAILKQTFKAGHTRKEKKEELREKLIENKKTLNCLTSSNIKKLSEKLSIQYDKNMTQSIKGIPFGVPHDGWLRVAKEQIRIFKEKYPGRKFFARGKCREHVLALLLVGECSGVRVIDDSPEYRLIFLRGKGGAPKNQFLSEKTKKILTAHMSGFEDLRELSEQDEINKNKFTESVRKLGDDDFSQDVDIREHSEEETERSRLGEIEVLSDDESELSRDETPQTETLLTTEDSIKQKIIAEENKKEEDRKLEKEFGGEVDELLKNKRPLDKTDRESDESSEEEKEDLDEQLSNLESVDEDSLEEELKNLKKIEIDNDDVNKEQSEDSTGLEKVIEKKIEVKLNNEKKIEKPEEIVKLTGFEKKIEKPDVEKLGTVNKIKKGIKQFSDIISHTLGLDRKEKNIKMKEMEKEEEDEDLSEDESSDENLPKGEILPENVVNDDKSKVEKKDMFYVPEEERLFDDESNDDQSSSYEDIITEEEKKKALDRKKKLNKTLEVGVTKESDESEVMTKYMSKPQTNVRENTQLKNITAKPEKREVKEEVKKKKENGEKNLLSKKQKKEQDNRNQVQKLYKKMIMPGNQGYVAQTARELEVKLNKNNKNEQGQPSKTTRLGNTSVPVEKQPENKVPNNDNNSQTTERKVIHSQMDQDFIRMSDKWSEDQKRKLTLTEELQMVSGQTNNSVPNKNNVQPENTTKEERHMMGLSMEQLNEPLQKLNKTKEGKIKEEKTENKGPKNS